MTVEKMQSAQEKHQEKEIISDRDFNIAWKKNEGNKKNPLKELDKQKAREIDNIKKTSSLSLGDKENKEKFKKNIENNKDIIRDKDTESVFASYILGSNKGATLRIKKLGGDAIAEMYIYNNGLGSVTIEKKISLTQVEKLPAMLKQTLQQGVQLTTVFDIKVRGPYKPNENLLEAIDKKTTQAVKIFKDNTTKK